jgi:hypothetical protein
MHINANFSCSNADEPDLRPAFNVPSDPAHNLRRYLDPQYPHQEGSIPGPRPELCQRQPQTVAQAEARMLAIIGPLAAKLRSQPQGTQK